VDTLKHVLVVDDEANIRRTLSICLETDGHQVTAVSNPEDALSEAFHRTFDIAFIDLRLGVTSGLDLIPALLATTPWIKIIVITAYASIDTAVEAIQRGASDVHIRAGDVVYARIHGQLVPLDTPVLGALDTGSSFEGMGASREATFATLLEPVLFVVAGALCLHSGARSFADALAPSIDGGPALVMWFAAIVALTVVVQVETGRVPIDDPATHLELTMVHEVMVLDHSGRELAFLQLGSAIKLYTGVSVVAMLLNPLAGTGGLVPLAVHLGLEFDGIATDGAILNRFDDC